MAQTTPVGHSELAWHPRHMLDVGSQIGVEPEQFASLVHPTQASVVGLQFGVAPVHAAWSPAVH